jgi:hypothetical protein
MVNERPKLAASEIKAVLRAALQKLPSLRGTQSVRIRPYSGPKSFTWEVDKIKPEVEPVQSEFVDMAIVVDQAAATIRPRSQPSAASLRTTKRRSTASATLQEKTMRRFMVHLTEVEFEDGDEASDETVQNYQKQLSETVRNAAQSLSLRTVKGARIDSVSVAEIKPEL